MSAILSIRSLSKNYKNGVNALSDVSLEIREGEIFALLGPNGAGKTTLIRTICGLTRPNKGRISIQGHDIAKDYRKARSIVGLVGQEIPAAMFETVEQSVRFSQGLFNMPVDMAIVEDILKRLSLWEKRSESFNSLSGGMKRRLLVAKALVHKPRILFLDEPSAGVDIHLRKDMWNVIAQLQKDGVTIILTTHYLEEAEELADRVGIINKGQLSHVAPTEQLMREFGRKELTLSLAEPITELPHSLRKFKLTREESGKVLRYAYYTDPGAGQNAIMELLAALVSTNTRVTDLQTHQSSLEDVFVELVGAE
ncbi:ABC transporter ATP-binding protein [Roseibium sp. RKSG952]|uniref:ABC transporter ATP-binding protein n=1 Tax=Roseibium sp. RKSG952 TaxID=2529384 RepID=UPI0012BC47EA|nr:ABC transporter ATP-binding protein [Roseibium sp. RKSG952]MTH94958.1 ABC transporter ATP-binding protein [Roseibium sp. RKSG952]